MSEFNKGEPYFVPGCGPTLETITYGGDAVCYVAKNIDTEWLLNLLNGESGQRERADRAEARADDYWSRAVKEQERAEAAEALLATAVPWPLRVELEKPGIYAVFEDAGELADQLDGDQSTIDKLKERCKAYEQANANLDRELNATIDKLWRKHRKAKRQLAAERALLKVLLSTRGVK